jgi:phage shock protein A
MGTFERLMTVIKAKLSNLVGRAEDPRETLDYSYEQQLQMLNDVKRGVADVVTAKKRLELQAKKLEQGVVKLDSQARDAMQAGREDLARTALERKVGVQSQLQDLDRQTQDLEAQQQKLVENERALSTRIESFRSEKEVIKAQYSAAEAQVKIGEAATGIGDQMASTGRAIDRAREKTEEMEARGAAMDELIASGTLEDVTSDKTQLDRELEQIASQSQVDRELEKMKAEVGAGSSRKELES